MRFNRPFVRAACLVPCVLQGCGPATPHGASAAASVEVDYPLIVTLKSRSNEIAIHAGPGSSLYSVRDQKGGLLVNNLTLAQLKEKQPLLYAKFAPALAPAATAGLFMSADSE